jgi:hypothetical protein
MGRGGFPPSETGSFSAHHTAQWVGLFFSCQLSAVRKTWTGIPWSFLRVNRLLSAARLLIILAIALVICEVSPAQQTFSAQGPDQEIAAPPRPEIRGNEPNPQDAIKAILAAFDKYEVVGMGAAHGNQDLDDFILRLIRDPGLPGRIKDIAVECGNSLYQPILDRYIAGEDVRLEDARQVWRNTTQLMCNGSAFYEELFPLVRRINQKLPPQKKFRMLACDPPIDWSKVKTQGDYAHFLMMRDPNIASVMEKEILSKHRKALMFFGTLHLYHNSGGRMFPSTVEMYEKNYPGVTLVIADHAGFGSHSPLEKYNDEFEARMAAWPIPSLVADMAGTWLADLLDKTHSSGDAVLFRVGKDGKRTESLVDSSGVPISKMVDAYLYLGPRDLLLKEPRPAEISLDKDYVAEMKRRAAIMGLGPVTDQADPEKVSDRDYNPFFYDPNELQGMMKMKMAPPMQPPQ